MTSTNEKPGIIIQYPGGKICHDRSPALDLFSQNFLKKTGWSPFPGRAADKLTATILRILLVLFDSGFEFWLALEDVPKLYLTNHYYYCIINYLNNQLNLFYCIILLSLEVMEGGVMKVLLYARLRPGICASWGVKY